MKNELSIVAIIPLYNGEKYIEEAIKSVLSQTVPPDEFIVVDDGSSDNGPAIVEKLALENPITLLRKKNGGQSSARNYGVANSKSALIALLDQDDYWYSTHLEELIKPFRENHGIPMGWSYSNLDHIDKDGYMIERSLLNRLPMSHPKRDLNELLSNDLFILPGASLISKEAFNAVGGFDERLIGYEDDDLFLRIFLLGYENIYVNKPLSRWRYHLTSTSFTEKMSNSRMIYANKLMKRFSSHSTMGSNHTSRIISSRFFKTIVEDTLYRGVLTKDSKLLDRAGRDIREIIPYLSRKKKIFSYVILIVAKFPFLYPVLMQFRGLCRRIFGSIFA